MTSGVALFQRFIREWQNALRSASRQSRLKNIVLTSFGVAFEIGLFVVFYGGFKFIYSIEEVGSAILPHLFSVYFLGLGFMLVISGLATSYATFFRAGDVPMLFTSPLTMSQCTLLKFWESAGLSSWAFAFIVIPFVAAYAIFVKVSLLFVLWIILFAVPLVMLCAAIGVFISLCFGRWFPQNALIRRIIWIILIAIATYISFNLWQELPDNRDATRISVAAYVPGLRLGSHPLMPSMWTSEGVMSMTRGDYTRGSLFWLLLFSTAMTFLIAVEALGRFTYHTAWTRMTTGNRTNRTALLLSGLSFVLAPLPADARAIIIKDVRIFLRDPMQWSQAIVFFGLLTVYFANLRNLNYHELSDVWRNLMSFLNAFGVSTVAASLASRFAYPQLSLEGHGFWVLGLSPTRPSRIVITKFASTALVLVVITTFLMHLSTSMLNSPPESRTLIFTIVICLSVAVTAMATGLGTIFLDLEHRNPAAIVSGFGGTLNLLLCLGFIFAVVLPPGIVFHLVTRGVIPVITKQHAIPLIYLWTIGISLIATIIPLRLGIRSITRRDF